MKSRFVRAARLLAGFCLSVSPLALAQDPNTTEPPEVRITAPSWKTAEPCPVCLIAPGILRVERSEPGKEPLTVRWTTDGTATSGQDYQELPDQVVIPAGATFVEYILAPLDDELVEGPEVVRVRLLPGDGAYRLSPFSSEALIVIGDIEFGATDMPQARLDIVQPRDGDSFRANSVVRIDAIVVWTESEIMRPVEFFAGDHLIGRSQGVPVLRPSIPCLPSVQTVYWTNPPAGHHELTARVEMSFEEYLHAPPVRIHVGDVEPKPTLVSIEATWPIAEESSYPLRRLQFTGRFTIRRTGPTDFSLPVFLHYSGTASPEDIDPPAPWSVSIPAGATSTEVPIIARPDEMAEGIETLIATLSNCPPDTDPPLGVPCYAFDIDPAHASATIFLRDDGITRADIDITRPMEGAVLPAEHPIVIEAVAIDLQGYISRVEFFDGDTSIGVSEIVFVRPPDPGTPIHHRLEWSGASPGGHILTARASISEDLRVTSDPVRIKVGEIDNAPPKVTLIHPLPGSVFEPMTPIELVAGAGDADGFVRRVVFLADGEAIGEVAWDRNHRPGPDGEQRFAFVWRYPMPGPHALRARAIDDDGASSLSEPVEIRVRAPLDIPIVTLHARDHMAVEPSAHVEQDVAVFVARRFGNLDHGLAVRYGLRGSAENGVDYEALTGWVRFEAGQATATIIVRPLPDDQQEGTETVIARLVEPDANTNPAVSPYRIGYRGRAVALIRDKPWDHDGDRHPICVPVGDGFIHVRFDVDLGKLCRLEASRDMKTWETVYRALAADGAIYFVDEESDSIPHRIYRCVEESPNLPE